MDKKRVLRFVGIVCWFLALFMLMNDAKEKKALQEQAEQAAMTQEAEAQQEEHMVDGVYTVVLPSKK